ncbi:unnamed protein product [Paramecium sonneborni]|uniref:Transmembrane protein n=1 Tax=Paramecium sonneborni TaxID=65129 RepID=A0A8S1PPB3_9CILI|nr:unnamed protein product [Paramecium sonneborni]
MGFQFKISDNVHAIIGLISSNVIEIVLLAYYANIQVNQIMESDIQDDFKAYKGLSVTGSVFMMITWILQILLIYKYNEKILYVIFGINTFSIFILLIGMGIGQQGINKVNDSYGQFFYIDYNYPVALWFIQLCLYLMSLINLHNFKQKKVSDSGQDTKKKQDNDDSQKQVQQTQTQANQSQVVMMGNNESQFTQQQQIV